MFMPISLGWLMFRMALNSKWTSTVDDGKTNRAWDHYDQLIQSEITAYNAKFRSTPHYATVDWHICKAMVWVESGGPNSPSWSHRVLQIGNPGDPAYAVLKAGKGHSLVIMSSQLVHDLKTKSINTPSLNVRAGIAYLFTRMARFEEKSIADSRDVQIYQHTVQPGDSFWTIAQKVGTTIDVLQAMNPGIHVLHPKQVLKYKKASMHTVVSSWWAFSTSNIGLFYNGGGDPTYSAKLDYVLELFKQLKR